VSSAALLLPLLAAIVFVANFNYATNVWWLNFVWMAGVLVSVLVHVRRGEPGRWSWRSLALVSLPLLVLLVAVAAAWIPLYDNWRWVGGGDSFGWFLIPERRAKLTVAPLSVLSVSGGPFEFFTLTSVLADNALMFVFEPTFFWHRMSKLLLSLLALAAMYAYFATVWRPRWALALCLAAATNFILIWLSFISFNHLDSFVFGYATLLLVTLVLRDPNRTWAWAAAGACGGVSLLFTGTAWADVVACGAALMVFGLVRRCWSGMAAYVVAAGVGALPVVLQLEAWIQRQMTQSTLGVDMGMTYWEHRWWIAKILLMRLPFGNSPDDLSPTGELFFWPAGPLMLAGMVLALLSLVPRLRQLLRLPRAGAALLALFAWGVALQSLTTSYGWPSWKRSFYLVPLQIFFALLPLTTLATLLRRWRFAHAAAVGLVFVAVAAYGAGNIDFLVHPRTNNWGNEIDALVQIHQRFLRRPVTLLAPVAWERAAVEDPDSDVNRAYHVNSAFRPAPLDFVDTATPEWLEAICPSERVFCYKRSADNRERFEGETREMMPSTLRSVPLYWNGHYACFECAAL